MLLQDDIRSRPGYFLLGKTFKMGAGFGNEAGDLFFRVEYFLGAATKFLCQLCDLILCQAAQMVFYQGIGNSMLTVAQLQLNQEAFL